MQNCTSKPSFKGFFFLMRKLPTKPRNKCVQCMHTHTMRFPSVLSYLCNTAPCSWSFPSASSFQNPLQGLHQDCKHMHLSRPWIYPYVWCVSHAQPLDDVEVLFAYSYQTESIWKDVLIRVQYLLWVWGPVVVNPNTTISYHLIPETQSSSSGYLIQSMIRFYLYWTFNNHKAVCGNTVLI